MTVHGLSHRTRHRIANGQIQILVDLAAWVVATPLAAWLRFEFSSGSDILFHTVLLGFILGCAQVAIGWALWLYRGRFRFGSFDEVMGVSASALGVGLVGFLFLSFVPMAEVPRSVPLIATVLALGAMLSARFLIRFRREFMAVRREGQRTLVFGAGESGEQLVRAIQSSGRRSEYVLMGLLDDDPKKRRLYMHGIRVVGTCDDFESIAQRTRSSVLVVAIAKIDSRQLLDLERRCRKIGVTMRVIPSATELVRTGVKLSDVADVTDEDLLGRRRVDTHEDQIVQMLSGRRVLITGAGGSIGSELARQVHSYDPAYLGLLDRDESALHGVQLSIHGRAMLDSDDLILADIRDPQRVREVMEHVRPDVVFHAAALKHLPMLEQAPAEAFKTNVLGTLNVLQAAREVGVKVFVNISTDKAADPVSILGYSKRTAERLTAGTVPPPDGRYLSVRFGNVLGSRGSVLTAFREQVRRGGPVTVTHPDVTRYFMTVEEAVHLVLQAATIGGHRETLILDMGEPVRIADVAAVLIEKSGRDIRIVYTGLRPGEKLHEVLASETESGQRPYHDLVTHVQVLPLRQSDVQSAWASSHELSRAAMQHMASDARAEPVAETAGDEARTVDR